MLEQKGNILSDFKNADAICFTSNGVLNKHECLVMGAGIAKAFKDKWSVLPELAGEHVKKNGNCVGVLYYTQTTSILYGLGVVPEKEKVYVLNFPTKHHYRDNSDLVLIEKSTRELLTITNKYQWNKIYLPRPGCGLGGLDWEGQVKPLLSTILDDRFIIINE